MNDLMLALDSRIITAPNLINRMRQKFDPNPGQNIKFGMASNSRIFAAFNSFNPFCYNIQCQEFN